MANHDLSGKTIAILATHGFERAELEQPLNALKAAGATVHVVSPEAGDITSWDTDHWSDPFPVDRTLDDVTTFEAYDALVLPGGQINPDLLRVDTRAIAFARGMIEKNKVVAAICHGPWLLVEADVLKGRTVTAYPSIRTDLRNAGAKVVDEQVVVDGLLITSRKPDDLEAFSGKIAEVLVTGAQARAA